MDNNKKKTALEISNELAIESPKLDYVGFIERKVGDLESEVKSLAIQLNYYEKLSYELRHKCEEQEQELEQLHERINGTGFLLKEQSIKDRQKYVNDLQEENDKLKAELRSLQVATRIINYFEEDITE